MIGFIANLLAYKMSARTAKWLARGIVALIITGAVWFAIEAIRSDAREDLLDEQAEQQRLADEAQRIREATAQGERDAALAAGATIDAAQQKEITDATKDLADSRPTARQRARVCVELQQQDKAAGRAPRPC